MRRGSGLKLVRDECRPENGRKSEPRVVTRSASLNLLGSVITSAKKDRLIVSVVNRAIVPGNAVVRDCRVRATRRCVGMTAVKKNQVKPECVGEEHRCRSQRREELVEVNQIEHPEQCPRRKERDRQRRDAAGLPVIAEHDAMVEDEQRSSERAESVYEIRSCHGRGNVYASPALCIRVSR